MCASTADGTHATMCFSSFGLRIGVRADPGRLTHLAARVPPAWRPAKPGPVDRLYSLTSDDNAAGHILSVGLVPLDRAGSLDNALDTLEVDARHFVAEFARGRIFVHAGTVAIDGRAVVIPGRSGTGKSTLVAALVRRGATYYSDEYAVFDERGRVDSYPKALSLRADDDALSLRAEDGALSLRAEDGALSLRADDGARAASRADVRQQEPVPLGAIVSSRFAGSETTWQLMTMSVGQGMMALLDNTIAVRRQPEKTLVALQRAMPGVIVLVGPRGDADPTAEAVVRRLEGVWG